ncbi:MAG TPA: PIN domain-containing protein [Bryobacteraceae bacterium]|jgi:predicted nucleic acid-binding protein
MKSSTIPSDLLFVDTWGWLALADEREPDHAGALAEYRHRKAPGGKVTTDFVLDETITRLFRRVPHEQARLFSQRILDSAAHGFLRLERIGPERFEAAWRLRLRYDDMPRVSFTDFTSFVVMRELKIRDVLSADAHFTQMNLGFHRLPRLH